MDDNITYRNIRLCRSSSLCDITANNSALFDTTMMSLPNTSINTSQTVIELQEKNQQLTKNLQSAHQEIDNLITENFQLKTDVQKYIKIIDAYKVINTDARNSTPCSARKRNNQKSLCATPVINKKQSIASAQKIEFYREADYY